MINDHRPVMLHYASSDVMMSVKKSSVLLFKKSAKNYSSSDNVVSLLRESVSYMLHVISELDTLLPKENEWIHNERQMALNYLKAEIYDWIVNPNVIGGIVFGSTVLTLSSWKQKAKIELKVYHRLIIIHSVCIIDSASPITNTWGLL